jgi:hypothetical protein
LLKCRSTHLKLVFILLILLGVLQISYAVRTDVVEIMKEVNSSKAEKRRDGLNALASYEYYVKGNIIKADSISLLALQLAEKEKNSATIRKAYILYSKYCTNDNSSKALKFLKDAINNRKKFALEDQFYLRLALADLMLRNGNTNEAEALITEANEFSKKEVEHNFISFLTLGNVYYEAVDLPRGLDNYYKALAAAFESENKYFVYDVYVKLIRFCIKCQLYSRSEELIQEAYEYTENKKEFSEFDRLYLKTLAQDLLTYTNPKNTLDNGLNLLQSLKGKGYTRLESEIYSGMRLSFMKNDSIGLLCKLYCHPDHQSQLFKLKETQPDMYYRIQALISENKGHLDSANRIWLKAEELVMQVSNLSYVSNFYIRYGQFFDRMKDYEASVQAYQKAYNFAQQTQYLPMIIESSALLSKAYFNTGNSTDAYLLLQTNRQLADSLQKAASLENLGMVQLNAANRMMEVEKNKAAKKESRHKMISFFVLGGILIILLYLLVFLSRRSISLVYFKGFGFFTFIFVFEFVLFLLHDFIHQYIHSAFILVLINVAIISVMLPLHHAVEHRAVAYLITKNRTKEDPIKLKSWLLQQIKKYREWLHVSGDNN